MAWPSPRPDPVTSATSPCNEKSLSTMRVPLHPAERLQVVDAPVQLRPFVRRDRLRRLSLFPRRAVIGTLRKTRPLQPLDGTRELRGWTSRVTLPPVRR